MAHREWQQARARTRREAGAPSIVVTTATELAKEMEAPKDVGESLDDAVTLLRAIADHEAAVTVEDATSPPAGAEDIATGAADATGAGTRKSRTRARKDADAGAGHAGGARPGDALAAARERGQRFGTLVHAILAAIDLDADADAVAEAASLYARLLGAGEESIGGAARAVSTALGHPVLRRAAKAARAGECRREVALTATLPDGRLLEGVADAAFFDEGAWTVVDFKTDADLALGLDTYRRQVALYAWAIARATGRPARGVLLKV